ncbi:MAG: DUF4097 family beta strand repeat-containing protein, partial [Chloroflexota bacterium]
MSTTTRDASMLEHEIGATGRFHLRQAAGSIRLRGVDGATARVRERHGRSLAELFQVETGAGSLSLTAPDRFGFDIVLGLGRRSSPDLEVEVPRTALISIETASGDLEADDLTGPLKIRTASGDVTLAGLAGSLELDSVSGEARIAAAGTLELRARTISGDLAVRGPRLTRAEVGTTSGDVRIDADLAGSGPFGIETVSGDVTIVGRMGLRIEARTVTGDLSSELPHRRDAGPGRKVLIVGDGSVPFSFKSVSGDLRVATPRDSLPDGGTTGRTMTPTPATPAATA